MPGRPGPATLVVGLGALARAIAAGLSAHGPVVLASPQPQRGPWFWRRVEPSSGEGIKAAATRMARVVIATDGANEDVHGAFLGLRKVHIGQAVVVHPFECEPPSGANEVPRWGRIALGSWWGEHHPLWIAWRERALAGKVLRVPALGPVGLLAESDVVGLVLAAFDEPEARWRAAGPPSSMEALAEHARFGTTAAVKEASIAVAARRAGVSPRSLQRFAELPTDLRDTASYDDTWRGGPARVRGPATPTPA